MNGNSASMIRAIRGPITLITIGVLFALNNFTQYGFDKTWPVILIVFGLLSLLRRGTQPAGAPPAGPAAPYTPPYSYPAPGGYSQSPYAGGPATTPGAPAGTAKGGFGTSAPPRSGDPGAPPGGSA
jgi:hypothetical protein